ncbi:hypothetical protein [Primorskyibacter marinus]|nr:hypothetical protein [Primorskyibacter marinus]
MEYSTEGQAQTAEELARLPDGSAIVEMMDDYTAMRDLTRLCR